MNWIRMDNWWMRSDPAGYNISVAHVGPFEVSYLAYAGAGSSAVFVASRVRVPDEPGSRRVAVREIRKAVEEYDEQRCVAEAERIERRDAGRKRKHA